jgi:plastocyanin
MRARKRYFLAVAVLGLTTVALPTIANSVETTPTISAYNEPGIYGRHSWMPSTATVGLGGAVVFKNSYSTTNHGLKFTGGTAGAPLPSCSGLPAAAETELGATSWEATCTFSKSGTYTFVCTVHPEMTGTITVKVTSTPTAVTKEQTAVTQTTATLNGSVSPEGEATSYYFEYGTTAAMPEKIPLTPQSVGSDFAEHPLSATLTNLASATEYHFELIAKYGSNTVLGGERTFTTHPLEKPKVTTGGTSVPGETEATLHGTVNPGGEATEYWFEYGTTTAYGSKTTKKPLAAGGNDEPVSAALMVLAPGTEYHYKLVAENPKGIAEGLDKTFTTASPPAKKSEPPSEPPPPAKEPTVTPSPPPPTVPLFEPPPESPLAGSPSLRSTQRGPSVKGSLDVSQSGAGGRLEVDLLAKSASLAAAHRSGPVRVGRLVRASVSAGQVSFSVGLSARAKSALRRHHRLALTVRIVLTPTHGATVTITRSVSLRA